MVIDRLRMTRYLLLLAILALALVACGPAQNEEDELATLTAIAEEEPALEVEETPTTAAVEEVAGVEDEPVEEQPVEQIDSGAGLSFDLYGGTDASDFETTESGLQYYFFEAGDGQKAENGQMLMVDIVGWLEDGTEITNSASFGGPIPLPVGSATGIIGLDEALTYLSTGSSARFVIPADLVVPDDGGPSPLPPGAIVFEMTVQEIVAGPPEAPQVVDEADYTVTDSGLKYVDLTEGEGPAIEPGQQASLHYTGWLEDNTIFDSSVGGQPITLVVGSGQVIPGWDEGLVGLKLGGVRQLVIPPDLAYGEGGSGPIPPNAVIIFEVEAVDIQ